MASEPMPAEGVLNSPAETMRVANVVIGSGPGGAITAAVLAEAGREVLVVEEGPYLSLDSCRPYSRREMVQKYRSGGVTAALGRCKVAYVEGRCVGGGSEINSGLYHRTPEEIVRRWQATYAIDEFEPASLEEHFLACERDLQVSPLPGTPPPISLKLHHGATALGWASAEIPRWYAYGSRDESNPPGRRQSMTETYVPRAMRAGARLLPNTRVARLSSRNGCWRVQASHRRADGKRRGVVIEAENVFVAGGAVQTPALLRRSGVRNAVGRSLRLHPTVKVVAVFPDAVNYPGMGVAVHQVREFAPRYAFGCSISSAPYIALAMLDHPRHGDEVTRNWRHAAIYYAMSTGGRGTIGGAPGFQDPLVRFRLDDGDLRVLSDALRNLCRSLLAAGADALYPSITGHPVIRREADLTRIPRPLPAARTNLMSVHLMGSCPMGEDPHRCAADSFGRVHGTRGLFIADASLLGGAPCVNPQGSIMAVVRRNAVAFVNRP